MKPAFARQFVLVVTFMLVALVGATLLSMPSSAGGDKKPAIPDMAAQAKAEALIKDVYAAEYKKAEKDPVEKAQLAAILLQEARDTKDYPAGKFVLFKEARALAMQASDVSTALQAVEEWVLAFPIDPEQNFSLKVETLDGAAKGDGNEESQKSVIEAALLLLEEALTDDNYDAAGKLVLAAEKAAKSLKSVPVLNSIRKRGEEIKQLEQEFAKIKDAVAKLKTAPNDGDAASSVGKYQAFVKGNWAKGLPLLAKGNDELFKKLAKFDLFNPKDPSAQMDMGNDWYKAAAGLQGLAKIHVLLRANHWLQTAEFRLKDKQSQEQVRKTIHDIMSALPPQYHVGEIEAELRQLVGHNGPVFGVAISPDGRKVATASQDATVRVWDAKTGQLLRTLTGHGGPVWTVAFSPDSRWIASGSYDSTIRLWDLVSGRSMRTLQGHTDYVRGVAFTPDGDHLVSVGDDATLRMWKVTTGEAIQKLEGHHHFVMGVALSGDGKRAITASLDKTGLLWDLNSGKTLQSFKGHKDTVLSAAFAPDGTRALTASSDKSLRLWDADSGETIHVLRGHNGYVTGAAFTPDGRRAVSCSYDKSLRLWDLKTGSEVRQLQGHTDIIWSVAFSPDGRWAVSGGHDKTAKIWGGSK